MAISQSDRIKEVTAILNALHEAKQELADVDRKIAATVAAISSAKKS